MSDERQADQNQAEENHARFLLAGTALADAVDAAIEPWVIAAVLTHAPAAGLEAPAAAAAVECRAVIVGRLRELCARDVSEQTTTPLQLLRGAVVFPTAVLREANAARAVRDQIDADRDPDDIYALSPVAFADFGPEVGEAGLLWGAAKAYLHLAGRRR